MANMLQSSQTQATQAPSFYTDYLSGLASAGQTAQQQAQFAGAQPLQTQAFQKVCQNFGAQQPTFQSGQQMLGQAAGQNITGAAAPFLAAGTSTSPLTAMQPYAQQATCTSGYCAAVPLVGQAAGLSGLAAASPLINRAVNNDPSQMAAQYMSPFARTAAQAMSDIAQRNIRQNLSPAATAAAVGSGQFGSQRGAQVLGQIQSQAQQDLNAQIAQMMNTGYGQALQAAGQQQTLLGQLGQLAGGLTNQQAQNLITGGLGLGQQQTAANQIASQLGQTAASAQQAGNAAQLQAGQTAAQAAAQQAQALQQAGAGMGNLAQQANAANLACINALSTLGGQQQTIAQNQQLFPLTTLSSLAGLLQGYQIPTSTKTTLCMSPLSGVAAVGTGLGGLLQTNKCGTNLLCTITGSKTFGNLACRAFKFLGSQFSNPSTPSYAGCYYDNNGNLIYCQGFKSGGHIQSKADGGAIGCMSMVNGGAIPQGFCAPACAICTPYASSGGLMGATGCATTQYRGGLPFKG